MLRQDGTTIFGCDPEGFFSVNGQIVGSEKFIPERGIDNYNGYGKIVRDGVQFELNPYAGYGGYANTKTYTGILLTEVEKLAVSKGATVCFDGVREVSREELDSLSPKCRVLGCQPSLNIYGAKPITVDAEKYLKRSAGGHIHFGLYATIRADAARIIPLCDILVGNTCVLIDRDENAAERRLNYGRAGEYRLPIYGIEYRTLSNFWLRSPYLMDLAFGLAFIASSLLYQTAALKDKAAWNDLADLVKLEQFERAINGNDFDLALNNFKSIIPFFKKHVTAQSFVINATNIDQFLGFVELVQKRGLSELFPGKEIAKTWQYSSGAQLNTYLAANL